MSRSRCGDSASWTRLILDRLLCMFSPCGLGLGIASSNAGQNNWRTIRKFSDQRQVSAHRLDGLAQSGKQQIAALFKTRNTVLRNTQRLGHADLGELASVP